MNTITIKKHFLDFFYFFFENEQNLNFKYRLILPFKNRGFNLLRKTLITVGNKCHDSRLTHQIKFVDRSASLEFY